MARIHRIHRGEILHIREIHVHPCDIGEAFADRSEERAEILQHLLRLRAHIAIDEPAGTWTQCHLPAEEQELAHTHAGRKRTHWRCDLVTAEGFSRHVVAGPADVVAIGTRFDVRLQQDSTLVSVLEGRIAVGLAAAQPGTAVKSTVLVGAGEQVQVAANQLPAQAVPAQIQRNTAWLRRQIVFEQEPLASVVAEFNRYRETPIEIETPALRGLVISGTFSADDTESFVAFLRTLEGVRVEVTPSHIRVRRM